MRPPPGAQSLAQLRLDEQGPRHRCGDVRDCKCGCRLAEARGQMTDWQC